MALIILHGCAGWSAPLLFANPEDRFSRVGAHMSIKHSFRMSEFTVIDVDISFYLKMNRI